jgi:hypothetical protein
MRSVDLTPFENFDAESGKVGLSIRMLGIFIRAKRRGKTLPRLPLRDMRAIWSCDSCSASH